MKLVSGSNIFLFIALSNNQAGRQAARHTLSVRRRAGSPAEAPLLRAAAAPPLSFPPAPPSCECRQSRAEAWCALSGGSAAPGRRLEGAGGAVLAVGWLARHGDGRAPRCGIAGGAGRPRPAGRGVRRRAGPEGCGGERGLEGLWKG